MPPRFNSEHNPRLAPLIAALAPDARRELIVRVGLRPGCIQEVALRMDLERSQVSKHLRLLRERGVLDMARDGHRHVYRLGGSSSVTALAGEAVVLIRSGEGSTATFHMSRAEVSRLRLGRELDELAERASPARDRAPGRDASNSSLRRAR